MIWKILDLVFDERVARAFAAIVLLFFSYMIIFEKNFESVDNFTSGFAVALAVYKLFLSSGDEEPRRKIPWRRRAS